MPISKPNGLFELPLVIIYISVILKPTKRKTIKIYTENYLKNPTLDNSSKHTFCILHHFTVCPSNFSNSFEKIFLLNTRITRQLMF